ncbi:MAG: hypothetical protein LC799_13115 [Actinobacteria bacterium]|nr:hypothetical protein [Actinomycetota bacterium]
MDLTRLRAAYWAIRPKAALGVDGVTWDAVGVKWEVMFGFFASHCSISSVE